MKIAIIGAGINGLYLAWKLAEKGEKVTVFEKKEKIGKEACSGLFSERILEFIPESQILIQNQITSVLIYFPKCTLRINFSKRFLVMNHFELDNLVFHLAEKSGAKILLKHDITKPDIITLKKEFDRIVGCDGPNSTIRKKLSLKEPSFRLAIQGFTPKKNYTDFVETWPSKEGFIWKIPRGEKTEYGIIGKPKEAREVFDDFLKKNNLKIDKLESGIVPQGFIIPKNSSVTLCGDAAGLTKPWSGGGVVWGLTAAEILLKNFPDFLKYQKEMNKFFLLKIILSKIAIKMVYFLGFNASWLLPRKFKIEGDFLL